MATDRRRDHRQPARGADPCSGGPSLRDSLAAGPIPARPPVSSGIASVVLCGPAAVVVLVLVARHAWPVWWLVIAGMLLAWTGDALWNVGDHLIDAAATHRQTGPAGSAEPPPTPASRAGEPR